MAPLGGGASVKVVMTVFKVYEASSHTRRGCVCRAAGRGDFRVIQGERVVTCWSPAITRLVIASRMRGADLGGITAAEAPAAIDLDGFPASEPRIEGLV
jgi:hypothetical protein